MHRERKLAALRRSLKDDGWAKGAEANFFCPKHEHHKRKLAVNVESDVFHCWVCGWGGHSLLPLLTFGGKDHSDYVEYAAEVEKPRAEVSKEYDQVRLPREFRPLCIDWGTPYYRQAIAYLAGRGITADDVLTYKLGYAEEGPLKERIIFPSFDEYGELNFVVGRGIWERVQPPYMTNGRYDKNIIFNDLLVDWSRPITLVEGPFDAIKAGTQAVALQGKFMSDRLFGKILERKVPVNIALDQDAYADTLRLAEQLMKLAVDVRLVSWKVENDPGEMTKERFSEYLARAAPFKGMIDLVKYRVLHSGTAGRA